VRAPNIVELFQPQVTNFPQINPPDPCSVNSDARTGSNAAAVRALCLAQGVPNDLIDNFTFTAGQVEGLVGGNRDLKEETADTVTFGAVFRSQSDNPWLSSLQLSLDWYRINIVDAITTINADKALDRCFDPQFNSGFSVDNPYCRAFSRTVDNGEIFALQLQQNIGGLQTSGIDVQLDWAADVGPGRVGVNWVGAWLNSFDQQDLPGAPWAHNVDTIGQNNATTFPNWKWTFNATYELGGLGLNARWRYIAGMTDVNVPTFEVPSVSYFDAGASYKFASGTMVDGLALRIGVTNLTDKRPQIFPSYVQSNTDPSSYDVLGRRYFVSANYAF
jgi:outer membrane receptor for ferrienterochelin and colicin